MIHEIRLYTVVNGRMNVALERFQQHLPALFARHGIRNVGRWTATAGANGPMFVYMMAYRDLAEREAQWGGFYVDPDWFEMRARTQGDEEATERFDILFTRQNPGWTPPGKASEAALKGVHDLIFAEVAVGTNATANAFLNDLYLPLLAKAGGEVMMFSDVIAGPALPRTAIMVAWRDVAARQAGWRYLAADAILNEEIARQRKALGRAAIGKTDTILLEPTPALLPEPTLGRALLVEG